MVAFRQRLPAAARWGFVVSVAGLFCVCGASFAVSKSKLRLDPWQAALNMRAGFEAEPTGTHTPASYMRVMEAFRAIYHGDPADIHAPRAVAQVAELLAEQGRELGDRKSLHDAARQYEFLASQYPAASLAPEALARALELLGPDAANDSAEARKVRTELATHYPRYARTLTVAEVRPPAVRRSDAMLRSAPDVTAASPSRSSTSLGATSGTPPQSDVPVPDRSSGPGVSLVPAERSTSTATNPLRTNVTSPEPAHTGIAQVTGIRHWSTLNYTRVAIDLGDEVQFEAARVENPDRIFFDLHHSKLAAPLAGKSFTITDDGFLTKIRAAQFSGDITRVVLDVHEVTEYSAFLLPNPYRLIIDIHGKRPGEAAVSEGKSAELTTSAGKPADAKAKRPSVQDAAGQPQTAGDVAQGADAQGRDLSVPSTEIVSPPAKQADHYVPRRLRESSAATAVPASPVAGAEASGLPPMPVTDGSAAFGLPPKRTSAGSSEVVAPPRVVISAKPTQAKPVPNTVTSHTSDAGTAVAAVSDQPGKVEATSRPTSQPIVSKGRDQRLENRDQKGVKRVAGVPAQIAAPTADGETSLVRALGLKIGRIVIDAGHGGHDSGTLGIDGIEEKDVVLDVALRLGKLLHDRLGAEIVYTRADDTFIPLETRTAIANKAQADLFISVHANSSPDASARGVEVYYLNFTSDPEAMRVASRENAVSSQSVHELSDLVKRIALKDKIDESRELAADVDESLYKGLAKGNDGLKNRGVKKAPFVVLIGANMPSILAEISFVSNPDDADQLNRPEYRQRVAESLYRGVARYAAGINGGHTPAIERAAAGSR